MKIASVRRRLAAISVGAIAAAVAQGACAQEVLHSPRDIATCLCMNQKVTQLRGDLDRQKQVYDIAKGDYDGLSAQAETQRGQVNVNDSNSITAYRQLLERRDAAEYHYKVEVEPAYAAGVADYNKAVEAYNTSCGSKMYDSVVLAEVQKTLYCPR